MLSKDGNAIVIDPDLLSIPSRKTSGVPKFDPVNASDLLPQLSWVDVPAGKSTIKKQVRIGQHKVKYETIEISAERSVMSATPITVEQWQVFVNDPEGYSNKIWWTYSYGAMRDRSRLMKDSEAALDDWCGNVNFWGTLAFTFWLSARTGKFYRLPWESEWLMAVTHADEIGFQTGYQEWMVASEPRSKLPFYGNSAPVLRGKEYSNDDLLAVRSTTNPIARQDNLCFRIVQTDNPAQAPSKPMRMSLALKLLEDDNYKKRDMGLEAIMISPDETVVPKLIEMLQDNRLNSSALIVIKFIADRVPIPVAPIVELLGNHRDARMTLVEMGTAVIDPLKQVMQCDNPYIRDDALQALVDLLDNDALPLLVDTLQQDDGANVRSRAARLMGQLGDTSVLPVLQSALDDEDRGVVQDVERAIKKLEN